MTADQFWAIIDRVHSASDNDMDEKCALLKEELTKLSDPELRSFIDNFDKTLDHAYTWPLWAAAYIMNGGCSDDSFIDFRCTLLSLGRDTFEAALDDPNTLATLDLESGEDFIYEGFQYVAMEVLEAKDSTAKHKRYAPSPRQPAGERWDEDEVNELFPTLAQKFT